MVEREQLGSPDEGRLPVETTWSYRSPVAPSNPGERGAGLGFPALRARGAESAETPTKATEEPHCGPGPAGSCPRCGYDSGGAWEALSSAGGKRRGGAFWAVRPEKGGAQALPSQRMLSQRWALGNQ